MKHQLKLFSLLTITLLCLASLTACRKDLNTAETQTPAASTSAITETISETQPAAPSETEPDKETASETESVQQTAAISQTIQEENAVIIGIDEEADLDTVPDLEFASEEALEDKVGYEEAEGEEE